MKNYNWQSLFKNHGFFWNEELAEFVGTYGKTKHIKFLDGSDQINFLDRAYIEIGSEYGPYDLASEYLRERIAPVGDYDREHILLFLTESGRLIGFDDYRLSSWGSQHWRAAIPLLLSGDAGLDLGLIPT